MKNRMNDWIIVAQDGSCLYHPRGEYKNSRDLAHGWHYKKEALEVAKCIPGATVERRW